MSQSTLAPRLAPGTPRQPRKSIEDLLPPIHRLFVERLGVFDWDISLPDNLFGEDGLPVVLVRVSYGKTRALVVRVYEFALKFMRLRSST